MAELMQLARTVRNSVLLANTWKAVSNLTDHSFVILHWSCLNSDEINPNSLC